MKTGKLFVATLALAALPLAAQQTPQSNTQQSSPATLDNICVAFADVIDAKSPFTLCHSTGVSQVAVAMGEYFQLSGADVKTLRRAALLHDIGKLGVSNSILEKDGKLTAAEWEQVTKHPFYTYAILNRISGFEEIREIAASHHEKLDGSGYYRGLREKDLPLMSRILAVADIYDALAAKRPYREALPKEKVLAIIGAETPHKLDSSCVEALASCVDSGMPELSPTSYLLSLYTGMTNFSASAQAVY
jgi:putative nucleotidyltransferase with HDIG domain